MRLLVAGTDPVRHAGRLEALLGGAAADVHLTACPNAADTLRALQGEPFDAAVIDAELADDRTVAALSRLRRHGVGTPILYLAERNDFADARQLIERGGDACLIGDGLVEERLALAICGAVRRAATAPAASRTPAIDQPTGLLSRTSFVRVLEREIALCRESGAPIALLMLDVQDFRNINQTFGYAFGDSVLGAVAEKLRANVRKGDVVGHFGGDQFGILLSPGANLQAGVGAARKLVDAFVDPVEVGGHKLRLHVVIGVAARPDHGHSADSLLASVDAATVQAKKSPGSVAASPGGTTADPAEAHALAADLRQAAARDEYFLCYQPKIDIRTGKPVGCEALIRWRHPVRGLLAPDLFIPLAERTGLIEDLTFWAVRRVLADLAIWSADQVAPTVSVNISAVSLRSWRIVEGLDSTLRAAGARAQSVSLEITESVLIHDIERARAVMAALKGLGFHIAIDDFGAGYSSIGYLRRLPLDEIKIDRSLIRTMLESPRDRAIVKSAIDLGRSLGLDVVAEGVEDTATLAALADLGCPFAQGYHISRPLEAEDLRNWWMASMTPRIRAIAGR